MPELHSYAKPHVPREIAVQIRSYVRVQWPHVEAWIGGKLWDVPPDFPARNFVILDGEKLVSHAEANFRVVQHAGETFKVGGVSAVFTFPGYRGGGFARQVVRAATEYLKGSDADVAMLFCGQPLRGFYASLGWEPIDAARIHSGDRAAPAVYDGLVMMRFISQKGCATRPAFETHPVYVGERTW